MTLSVWFVHADHEGLLCCTLFSLVNFIFPFFRYIVKALSQIFSSATAPSVFRKILQDSHKIGRGGVYGASAADFYIYSGEFGSIQDMINRIENGSNLSK